MTARTTPSRDRLVVVVAALAGLLLIAASVVAIWKYDEVRDDKAVDRARSEAVTAAEQFALRMDGIELGNFEAYKKSVAPMLTTKEKTVFEQQFKQFEQVYKQSQGNKRAKPGKGRIIYSGASDADLDSATVLVAHDSTIPGQAQALHFRWQLGMRKVEGDWLVDDFTPVD